MDELILDRRGRLQETPAFLAPVSERERSLTRLGLFLLMGVALAIFAVLLVLIGVLAVAGGILAGEGQSFTQALQTLNDGDREGRSLLSYAYEFSAAGLGLFAAAGALIALAAQLYKRPMRSFITAAPRFRWRMAALGMAVAAPVILLALAAELSWSETPLEPPILQGANWAEAAGYAAIAAVFLFLAALAEEMVFRGWLLQQTAAFTRSVPVILAVNGIIFSLIHFDPDPGAFAVRAAMGVGWAWIALRLGGLEFAAGAHLANNLAISLLVQPFTLTAPTGEAADPRSVLVQLGIIVVTVAAVELGLRRNRRGRIATT